MKSYREEEWSELARRHRERVEPVLRPHVQRKSHHQTHPVYDFLFSYYSFRVSNLERWSPGFGIELEGEGPTQILSGPLVSRGERGRFLDPCRFPAKRFESLRHVRNFLAITTSRTPNFGCAGLHEWAMLYRTPEVRYQDVPLRMSTEELARLVESQAVVCSHFDAFRFFTEAARPLNRLQPAREKQTDLDQPGCLHVNMDLYKWSYKFWPWVPSELVWDCFLLAAQAREIDMRASPYDLQEFGFEPIRIETMEGRKEYEREQRRVLGLAEPLRRRLCALYDDLIAAVCVQRLADRGATLE